MQTVAEYLQKTESATRILFDGIASYQVVLHLAPPPTFVTSYTDDADLNIQLEAWAEQNREAIEASRNAVRQFSAESFALATLCGSVLQVAAKAVECFSTNSAVPHDLNSVIKERSKAARFCIGKEIRRVPLGLVILAGRNQHIHFEDETLREPNITVFDRLAVYHGRNTDPLIRDPGFDLNNPSLISCAHNVTYLIKWRSYEAYDSQMRELLAI